MDDDELISAIAAGQDTALRELFGRHAPWLAARLRSVLPVADTEDVLQETFVAVWQGARRYRRSSECRWARVRDRGQRSPGAGTSAVRA